MKRLQLPRFASVQHIIVETLPFLKIIYNKIPKCLTGLNISGDEFCTIKANKLRVSNAVSRSFLGLQELSVYHLMVADLSSFITNNSTLRVICVQSVIVTDESLEKIASCCPLLETLVLLDTASKDCGDEQLYTERGVRAITKQCPNLQRLELRTSDPERSAVLSDIFGDAECLRLTCLFVEESAAGFLDHVVVRLPHLEELSIDTSHATPEQVVAAAQALPHLRRLRVQLGNGPRPYSGSGRPFNAAAIRLLAAALPRAEDVLLFSTRAVRNPVQLFSRHCPSAALRRVHIRPLSKPLGCVPGGRNPLPWALPAGRCFWAGPAEWREYPQWVGLAAREDDDSY